MNWKSAFCAILYVLLLPVVPEDVVNLHDHDVFTSMLFGVTLIPASFIIIYDYFLKEKL